MGSDGFYSSGNECVFLEMRGILKRFPGVVALDNVSFDVKTGEVHGLVGENGAGKSTLIKVLSGAYHADAGEITVAGERVEQPAPLDMIRRGVAVIYQELMLAPHLSVAENLFFGNLPRRRTGLIDWSRLRRRSLALMERLGFPIDPEARLGTLSVAQRQMVAIARTFSRNARVIVLDEPSAVLGGSELEKLFELIHRLKHEGMSFIYISHRLQEVFAICDRVTVLRDGALIGTKLISQVDTPTLISMMVGRQLTDIYPKRTAAPGDVVLRIKGLTSNLLSNVDLEIREGEILGICGLAGSGRTELLRAIIAADKVQSRHYELRGTPVRPKNPRQAIGNGMSLLPEDRKLHGCFLPQSVAFNITISRLRALRTHALLSRKKELTVVGKLIRQLNIRTPDPDTPIASLSGGNQQKCMMARSLSAGSAILLVDEPTRGVDVGAKREIYELLAHLADNERAAIAMVSSELPEILGLSDRIMVMRDGRVAVVVERGAASEERLLSAAIGAETSIAA
jgi:ribose transport system ATP-binding protein